jgi:hypothetical protein
MVPVIMTTASVATTLPDSQQVAHKSSSTANRSNFVAEIETCDRPFAEITNAHRLPGVAAD